MEQRFIYREVPLTADDITPDRLAGDMARRGKIEAGNPAEVLLEHEVRERVARLMESDNHYQKSGWEIGLIEEYARNEFIRDLTPVFQQAGLLHTLPQFIDEKVAKIVTEAVKRLEAEKLRMNDPMTGLETRAAFNQEIPKRLAEIARNLNSKESLHEKGVAIISLDFDHFKHVNDTYGHGAGDMALATLGAVMKQAIRNSDSAYRIGGEEFVVVLPETTIDEAAIVAEKLRAAVEATPIQIITNSGEQLTIHKTVSLGVGHLDQMPGWQEQVQTPEGLQVLATNFMKLPDGALYEAKENGRNRVSRVHDSAQTGEQRAAA